GMTIDRNHVGNIGQYSLKPSKSKLKSSEDFEQKTLNQFPKYFRRSNSLRSSLYRGGFRFIINEMFPQGISAFGVWYYQIPVLLGFVTTFWFLLKLWRHAR